MKPITDKRQVLTAQEVAEHYGFHVNLVRKMARENKLPARKIRNGARSYFRFYLAEVDAALSNGYSAGVVSDRNEIEEQR